MTEVCDRAALEHVDAIAFGDLSCTYWGIYWIASRVFALCSMPHFPKNSTVWWLCVLSQ